MQTYCPLIAYTRAPFSESYAAVTLQINVQLCSRGKFAALINLQEAIEVGGLFTGKGILSDAYVCFNLEVRLLSRRLNWHQQHGHMTCTGQISDHFGCWVTAHRLSLR